MAPKKEGFVKRRKYGRMCDAEDGQDDSASGEDGRPSQEADDRTPALHGDLKARYLAASKDVINGSSIRGAAREHGIAASALSIHIKNGTQPRDKLGRAPFLSEEEEKQLVTWCCDMSNIGCPLTKRVLPFVAQLILKSKKKMVFPPDNLPSISWVNRFMNKHTQISNRPRLLGLSRVVVTYRDIMQFFNDLKGYLTSREIDVASLLTTENASRVYSCDESGFFINGREKPTKILVRRGTKSYSMLGSESRLITTILLCSSASGTLLKPLIMNKGKTPKVYACHKDLDHDSYNVACSDSGWMTGAVLLSWIVDVFHTQILDMNIQRPVVLFLDGYSSHILQETLHFARDNGIIIYCLPPHASHILHPHDLGLLKSLEGSYREVVAQYMGLQTEQDLLKKHFPSILMKAIESTNIKENCINGFRSCGLVPFNPSIIKKENFFKETLEPDLDLVPISEEALTASTLNAKNKTEPQANTSKSHFLSEEEGRPSHEVEDMTPGLHGDLKARYLAASKDVINGSSIRGAAREHGIAASALSIHIKNRTQPRDKLGRAPFLSEEEEKQLVTWCFEMSKIGCPLTKRVLPFVAQLILKSKKTMVFPPDNLPSPSWVNRFMNRHSQISNRLRLLGLSRVVVTYRDVIQFFNDLKGYLTTREIDVASLLTTENASRVYSCDESGFFINGREKPTKILVRRGTKSYSMLGSESRLITTILLCSSASGTLLKPLIMNKGKTPKVYACHKDLDHDTYNVACSDSGWMTGAVLLSWIVDMFHTQILDMNIQRPVVLFLDGYSSHILQETLHFARDNGIIIYCLPPHASHILHPHDLGLLKSLEGSYREVVAQYMGLQTEQDLLKKHFPSILMKAIESTNIKENCINGFRSCGLVPFNPSIIKKENFFEETLEPDLDLELSEEALTASTLNAKNKTEPQAKTSKSHFLSEEEGRPGHEVEDKTPGLHGDFKTRCLTACRDVIQGSSIRRAAKKHGISESTLSFRVKNKAAYQSKLGKNPSLSEEDEKQLANWCCDMANIGYLQTKKVLPFVVQSILNSKKKVFFPPSNLPSPSWVNGFLKRHHKIWSRIPECPGHSRTPVTHREIMQFFNDLKEYLASREIDVTSLFTTENASRVFNCDESGFFKNAIDKSTEVLVNRESRTAYELEVKLKLMTSILLCSSASGTLLKPFIMNKGKTPTVYARHEDLDPGSFNVSCSDSGWMTGAVFFSWLTNLFHNELLDMNIQRPVILFVDGHSSHIFLETLCFARDNGIIIYCLPPHATNILQSKDIGVFKSLKESYREVVAQYKGLLTEQDLPEKHFPLIFMKAIERTNIKEFYISGFRACGLVPFNPSIIKKEEFLVSQESEDKSHYSEKETHKFNIDWVPNATLSGEAYKLGFVEGGKRALELVESFIDPEELALYRKRIHAKEDLEHYSQMYYAWREIKRMQAPEHTPFEDQQQAGNADGASIHSSQSFVQTSASRPTKDLAFINTSITADATTQRGILPSVFQSAKRRSLRSSTENVEELPLKYLEVVEGILEEDHPKAQPGKNMKASTFKEIKEEEKRKADGKKRKSESKQWEGGYVKKGKQKVTKIIAISESECDDSEDMESLYQSIDDDPEENPDTCGTCKSKRGLPKEWIGCNACPRWYHKICVNISFALSDEEIEDMEFVCNQCQ